METVCCDVVPSLHFVIIAWLGIKSTSVVSAAHFFTSQVNDDEYNHYVNYDTICNNNALCN